MQSSPTLPPPQPCPHQDVPATGSEALQLFIGTCGTQSVRSDWASHHACQTLLYLSLCYSDERWLAALGALSSLSPAPSSPHSSCPCSSTLSHCPISHQAVWHGQGKACSREKSLHGQQTTPLVSSSNLGMLSDVIGPSQPKDPPALVPGFGKSPAALATPWNRQPNPSASTDPTWSTVPAGHRAGLLPRLCHQDFSICLTSHSSTRHRHEMLPHLGISLQALTDRHTTPQ